MFEDGISIVIPAYNASSFIKDAIGSAQNAGFPKLEIIIVNDGSTDNTESIILSYEKKNTEACQIKIINQKNKGVSIARNVGIQNATNPWIMFLDADDWLLPNIFSKLKNLPKDGDVYIFSFISQNNRFFSINTSNQKENFFSFDNKTKSEILQWTLGYCDTASPSGISFQSSWATIYKKSTIQEKNIVFPKGIINGEDMLFRLAFFEKCNKCYCVNYPIYAYYNNPQSVTNRYKPEIVQNSQLFFDKLNPIINRHPELIHQYYRIIINNFFLEMDHFLFHKNNPLKTKEKYRIFRMLVNKERYQNSFAFLDCYWKKVSIIKRTIYHAMHHHLYKFVFFLYLMKSTLKKFGQTNG